MATYQVNFSTTGWISFDVEADSPEQALELARHGDDGEFVICTDNEHLNVFDGEVELDNKLLLSERGCR